MSTENLPALSSKLRDKRVVIVASTYNEKYTGALLRNCREELERLAPEVDVCEIRVPGAFEVPMIVRHVTLCDAAHAVIALGVILRGSTAHADLIGTAITNELLRASCDSLIPVIHEVLLLNDEQQAEERCCGTRLNRGIEAARAAVTMLEVTHHEFVPDNNA